MAMIMALAAKFLSIAIDESREMGKVPLWGLNNWQMAWHMDAAILGLLWLIGRKV